MIASLLVRVMGLVYRIPLTNLWGDTGLGTYGDAYQVYTLFLIISSISVPTMMSKLMGERLATGRYSEAKKVMRNALFLVGGMGLVCFLFMWFGNEIIAERVYQNPDAALVIRVLSPTVLIVSLMSVFRGYFNGTSNMRPTALSQLIEGFVNAVVSVVMALLLYKISLNWSVAGGISGTGVGALLGLIFLMIGYGMHQRRNPIGKAKISRAQESTKSILLNMGKLMIPIVLASTMFNLKSMIDASIFTQLMIGRGYEQDVITAMRGIYTGKFTVFVNVPIAFGDSLAVALVPSIASCMALGEFDEVKEKIQSVVKTVLLITVPAAVGLAVLGKPILYSFFPSSPIGGEMFWVGSFCVVFYSLNYVATSILQGMNKAHIPMRNGLICVVITSLLNIFFVYVLELGAYTLPLNSVIFSFMLMICNMSCALKRCHTRIPFLRLAAKPLICAGIMGVICFIAYVLVFAIFGSRLIALAGGVAVAVLVYFVLMVNLRGITKRDMDVLPFGRYLRFFRI